MRKGSPWRSSGMNGSGGAICQAGKPPNCLRRVADELAVEPQHVGGVAQLEQDRAAVDLAHGVQVVLECGDDAEVAPAAAQRPEQVLVLALRGGQDPAVRRHDLGRAQVVAGEAVPARQVSDPAAEREPAHAGRGDDAARRGQAVLVGGVVERAPGRAALGARGLARRIDLDRLHADEVDHDRVVGGAESGDAVRPPAHRDGEASLAREVHRRHHIVDAGAADDDAWAPVDHGVVHPARVVVRGILGSEDLASHLVAEMRHRGRRHVVPPHEPWSGHSYYEGPSKETLRAANPA